MHKLPLLTALALCSLSLMACDFLSAEENYTPPLSSASSSSLATHSTDLSSSSVASSPNVYENAALLHLDSALYTSVLIPRLMQANYYTEGMVRITVTNKAAVSQTVVGFAMMYGIGYGKDQTLTLPPGTTDTLRLSIPYSDSYGTHRQTPSPTPYAMQVSVSRGISYGNNESYSVTLLPYSTMVWSIAQGNEEQNHIHLLATYLHDSPKPSNFPEDTAAHPEALYDAMLSRLTLVEPDYVFPSLIESKTYTLQYIRETHIVAKDSLASSTEAALLFASYLRTDSLHPTFFHPQEGLNYVGWTSPKGEQLHAAFPPGYPLSFPQVLARGDSLHKLYGTLPTTHTLEL